MADRIEKVVDIKVNAKGAKNVDKNFKEINKGLKDIEKQAAKAFSPEPAQKLNNEIKKTATATVDVRSKLRDLQNKMAEIGDVGSAEFQQLAAEAGKYKDQMNNANAAIKSMSADFPKMALIGGGLTAMGGAAQGATGAMMLFGEENEDAAKAIQKMMAIQQVMNSVTVLTNSLSDESALGLKVRTVLTNLKAKSSVKDAAASGTQTIATVAQTIATGAASVAMAALNFVMNLNPVVALISGIAALAAGMYYFSASTKDATEENEKLNKSLDEIITNRDIIKAKFSKDEEINRRELILTGASKQALHDDDIKRIKNAEKNRKNDIKFIIHSNKALRLGAKLLRLQDKEDEAVANEDKIKANQATYNALLLNANDYKIELKEANKEFNDGETADQKAKDAKKIADAAARRQTRIANREANKQRILDEAATDRLIEDQKAALLPQTLENKIARASVLAERERAVILDNDKLTSTQKTELKLLSEQNEAVAIAALKKESTAKADAKDIADAAKTAADKVTAAKKHEKDLADLRLSVADRGRTENERELFELKAKYAKELELAKGNAILIAEIKSQQTAEEGAIEDRISLEKKEKNKASLDEGLAAAGQMLTALSDMNAAHEANQLLKIENKYAGELAAAEGDEEATKEILKRKEAEADKIRKKAFESNKKLQIASAIVTGIQSAMAAFGSLAGIPVVGPVLGGLAAAASAITTAMQIQTIKNTQFEGSGGGGVPTPTVTAPVIPSFNGVGNSPQNQLAQSLGQGQDQPVQTFVVAGDVTTAQSLERNAIQTASL